MTKSTLHPISRALGKLFSVPKAKRKADPDYGRFRRLAKKHGLKYDISSDGHIEIKPCEVLPRGLTTAHYDWAETLGRTQYCISNPSAVDEHGGYRE